LSEAKNKQIQTTDNLKYIIGIEIKFREIGFHNSTLKKSVNETRSKGFMKIKKPG